MSRCAQWSTVRDGHRRHGLGLVNAHDAECGYGRVRGDDLTRLELGVECGVVVLDDDLDQQHAIGHRLAACLHVELGQRWSMHCVASHVVRCHIHARAGDAGWHFGTR